MGVETFEHTMRNGLTVVSSHHSNDAVLTQKQWEYFATTYLPAHPERVYHIGDSNSRIRRNSDTKIDLLDKESDKVKCTIDLGRKFVIKSNENIINTTIKVRWWTTQPKDGLFVACDIDEVLVILGENEKDAEVSIEHWIEEFGQKITDPTQAISATFPTDHRTACAKVEGLVYKSKNLCGESDAAPTTGPVEATESTNPFESMDTNIFEFMLGGAYDLFKPIQPQWEALKDKVTEDLGPMMLDDKPVTFRKAFESKKISDKDGLRSAGWTNIHNLLPRGYHPRMDYLHDKFDAEYAVWEASPKTTERMKLIARYWLHFKQLVMADPTFADFIRTAFEEINTVTKITMEEDILKETQGKLADIICLQEVSVAKHQRLIMLQSTLEAHGYTLILPPVVEGVKTYGGMIVKSELA